MTPRVQHEARAGDVVVEAQDVHPAAVEDVVKRGSVTGEGVIALCPARAS